VVIGTLFPLLLGLGLLMTPAPYHQIVEQGQESDRLHEFLTRVIGLALLPLALALALDFYVATEKLAGPPIAIGVAAAVGLLALFFWYGLAALRWRRWPAPPAPDPRRGGAGAGGDGDSAGGKTTLEDRIKQVLMEARMVLPGVQALLGFQFSNMMTAAFDDLPISSKWIDLGSLSLLVVCIILLMTPSAYHRIVLEGQETEEFHDLAARLILAAMIPLALGIAGDLFIVFRKVTGSIALAATVAVLMLLFCYGLWFGFTIYTRIKRESAIY